MLAECRENDQLKADHLHAQLQQSHLRTSRDGCEREVRNLRLSLLAASDERATLQRELNKVVMEQERLAKALNLTCGQLEEKREEVCDCREEIAALRATLVKVSEDQSLLEEAKGKLRMDCGSLQMQLADTVAQAPAQDSGVITRVEGDQQVTASQPDETKGMPNMLDEEVESIVVSSSQDDKLSCTSHVEGTVQDVHESNVTRASGATSFPNRDQPVSGQVCFLEAALKHLRRIHPSAFSFNMSLWVGSAFVPDPQGALRKNCDLCSSCFCVALAFMQAESSLTTSDPVCMQETDELSVLRREAEEQRLSHVAYVAQVSLGKKVVRV